MPLLWPSESEIDRAQHEPPNDTRAYFRAHVLRRFGRLVTDVDWDRIRFSVQRHPHWSTTTTLSMSTPWNFNRNQTDELLATCETVEQLVEAVHECGAGFQSAQASIA